MATSQTDLALQMIAQLRVLDPSVSAEVGTPERKIIDTVAQALSEAAIDSNVISGALDIDAKVGSDLDNLLAVFGFGRQQGAAAVGFVTFSRNVASAYDIRIPINTQLLAPTPDTINPTSLTFVTTATATLPAGQLSVVVPIQCTVLGVIGNVAANTITQFYASPVAGITSVINTVATSQGVDPETDDEFKVRFKNTVFRNLSGTEDQFLALGIATTGTTKANVIGPISRYREYIQIPVVDDATADPNSGISGNGLAGRYTTALSTIPYSKHVYGTIPYYVANGALGTSTVFYRQDVDFALNTTSTTKNYGDTYRESQEGTGYNPTNPLATYQPNLTFYSVYTGDDDTVESIRPGDVVYFEHSYMSATSRNDYSRNILNCVDVYIDGENLLQGGVVIPTPGTINPNSSTFSTSSTNRLYYDNFRRIGEPYHRPIPGNIFTPMYWQPVTEVPNSIIVGSYTYFKGLHYWGIYDVSPIGGTVRSRNGIEWNVSLGAQSIGDPQGGPFTGPTISLSGPSTIEINNYTYDQNIIDLQTALDGNKQVVTDLLGHRATRRYFKPDITVMYTTGANPSTVNASITSSMEAFYLGQQFGAIIQLSDIMQAIHNLAGVDSVRWSKEILDLQGLNQDASGFPRDRITECDSYGNPLLNVIVDQTIQGSASVPAVQKLYLAGGATGGTFKISANNLISQAIPYNVNAATLQSIINSDLLYATTVTGAGTFDNPFTVTFSSNGFRNKFVIISSLTGGTSLTPGVTVFNEDFFLQDDEIPLLPVGDGTPNSRIIIRTRAQNTWNQL